MTYNKTYLFNKLLKHHFLRIYSIQPIQTSGYREKNEFIYSLPR